MYYHEHELRFRCTGCGACCTGSADDYVAVDGSEQEAIRRLLRISKPWFRRRYLIALDTGGKGLASKGDGRCVFLDAHNRCRVYPVRPRQCRSYPFWPEVVGSRSAWLAEARRCEGIGRGTSVPLRRIEAALKALHPPRS